MPPRTVCFFVFVVVVGGGGVGGGGGGCSGRFFLFVVYLRVWGDGLWFLFLAFHFSVFIFFFGFL